MFKCSKFTYKLNIFYVKCVLIPYEKKKGIACKYFNKRLFTLGVSCHRSGSYREGRRLSCHVQPCSTLCSSDTSSLLATLDSIPSKVDQR